MKPKLSIITINYNNLIGLQKTVSSVLNQTYRKFEYIIIDGDSSDGSRLFLESQNNTIDYWISEKDSGIYNAMNKGIKISKGEYLLFLNSGDHLYNEEIIEKVISKLNNYDLIYSNLEVINNGCSTVVNYPNQLRFSYMFFNTLPHPATFIKRTLFDNIGFYDENLKIVSDWKFFILALFKNDCSYFKIEEVVSSFYSGGISSRISSFEEKESVRKEYFESYFLDYKEYNDLKKQFNTKSNIMLFEIEQSAAGKKIVGIVLRLLSFLFKKNT